MCKAVFIEAGLLTLKADERLHEDSVHAVHGKDLEENTQELVDCSTECRQKAPEG